MGGMHSIAFLMDDSHVQGADLTDPELGNPGIGGTEYAFVSLAYELAKRKLARITFIHRNQSNRYPSTLSILRLDNDPAGLRDLLRETPAIDCMVLRGHDSLPGAGMIDIIPANLPVIAWTHNHLRPSTLRYLSRCEQIKRVVYVGREQCALAAGAACEHKSTYIYPGIYVRTRSAPRKERRAVYVGSLVPQKGFHRLARLWPCIRNSCPTAELDVIGSSDVYHQGQRLGSLGIASPSYEKLILRYLRNDPERHGVVFHGKMGSDKFDIIARALVGLPNPTGFTECCPATVVEMSDCGAAVVGMRQWGLCDTILDGTTGYLCRDDRDYVARVTSLLSEPHRAEAMGAAGQQFVSNTFSHDIICKQWEHLWNEVLSSSVPKVSTPCIRGKYPLRKIRVANHRLHSSRLHAVLHFVDRVRGVFLKRY
jgi:glycosyltransferase involved in cell wall biosynthesis